jgi:hypothetical protein
MLGELPVWFVTQCSIRVGRALAERVLAQGWRLIASRRLLPRCDHSSLFHPGAPGGGASLFIGSRASDAVAALSAFPRLSPISGFREERDELL